MSRKPCSSGKTCSPMCDATASDLFDDLFRKPSSADKMEKTTQVVKRSSPPPRDLGSEVKKKSVVISRPVSRYNYSYCPRSVERNRAAKKPYAVSKDTKMKLKVFEFNFSDSDDPVADDAENHSRLSQKGYKVQHCPINPRKKIKRANVKTDQSEVSMKIKQPNGQVRIKKGNSPLARGGVSPTMTPTCVDISEDASSQLLPSATSRLIGQTLTHTPARTMSVSHISSSSISSSSVLTAALQRSNVHWATTVSSDEDKGHGKVHSSEVTLDHSKGRDKGHSSDIIPDGSRVRDKVHSSEVLLDHSKGHAKDYSSDIIPDGSRFRDKVHSSEVTQDCGADGSKGRGKGIKRLRAEDGSSAVMSKGTASKGQSLNDTSKVDRTVISEIATRTRSSHVLSPLDEMLESPVKKSRSNISTPIDILITTPTNVTTPTVTDKNNREPGSHTERPFTMTTANTSSADMFNCFKSSLKKSSSLLSSSTKPHPLDVPSMSRSSSWPHKCSIVTKQTNNIDKPISKPQRVYSYFNRSGGEKEREDNPRVVSSVPVRKKVTEKKASVRSPWEPTVVRNVRQAHLCLVTGEYQEFFDEVRYLLSTIKPSEPLNSRCLGTLNLATHFLRPEFSQQLRSQGFTSNIITFLKDCLELPTLCLCAAVLFYVITRDKLNSDWTKEGTDILVGMLTMDSQTLNSDLTPKSLNSDLPTKSVKEMAKIKLKSKNILERVARVRSHDMAQLSSDSAGDSQEEESGLHNKGNGRITEGQSSESQFSIDTDNISVSELARETLISLTSAESNPHSLREQLRISGALDALSNMMISCTDGLPHVSHTHLHTETVDSKTVGGGFESEDKESVVNMLLSLERNLKILENCSILNKDNQSYLVIFDGSVLISRLTRLTQSCWCLLDCAGVKLVAHVALLSVFKLLLNLTHDNELGAHRVGEQVGVMETILSCVLELPECLSEGERFDVIVLALGLLINLTEHSRVNRQKLESTKVKGQIVKSQTDDDELLVLQENLSHHGNDSALRALVDLFLKHYTKAESASIDVPSPQRLSQLSSSSPHSSPHPTNQSTKGQSSSLSLRRDLTQSFASRLKSSRSSPRGNQSSSQSSQESDGMKWLPSNSNDRVRNLTDVDSDSESEIVESIPTDPLVFSRVDIDYALFQAGKHLQDSVLASYAALLVSLLVKHNHDHMDFVRGLVPSNSFAEMIAMLRKFISFMSMTGSSTGLDSIRHVMKYLEAL